MPEIVEWKPINPCEGCHHKEPNAVWVCRGKFWQCERYSKCVYDISILEKLLEYLKANPPEDSYGCVVDDPQYTNMFESMLKEIQEVTK
jgi:hypothetical protein